MAFASPWRLAPSTIPSSVHCMVSTGIASLIYRLGPQGGPTSATSHSGARAPASATRNPKTHTVGVGFRVRSFRPSGMTSVLRALSAVIAGLVPAIHVFLRATPKDVDAQHKAGHDGGEDNADHAAAPSLLRKLQPHSAVAFRIVAPALAHFHEQEQVHLGFDNVGNLFARRLADRLDGLAALAEHDLALAFALDVDRLLDANVPRAQFLPDFGFHRRVIRQFLVQPLEQLFARDLRGELADRRIRHLVGRIEPWPRRNALRQDRKSTRLNSS